MGHDSVLLNTRSCKKNNSANSELFLKRQVLTNHSTAKGVSFSEQGVSKSEIIPALRVK